MRREGKDARRRLGSPFVIPAKAGIQWFNKTFPQSGNDHLRQTTQSGGACKIR